jgi:hypothetical protein
LSKLEGLALTRLRTNAKMTVAHFMMKIEKQGLMVYVGCTLRMWKIGRLGFEFRKRSLNSSGKFEELLECD